MKENRGGRELSVKSYGNLDFWVLRCVRKCVCVCVCVCVCGNRYIHIKARVGNRKNRKEKVEGLSRSQEMPRVRHHLIFGLYLMG